MIFVLFLPCQSAKRHLNFVQVEIDRTPRLRILDQQLYREMWRIHEVAELSKKKIKLNGSKKNGSKTTKIRITGTLFDTG